MGKYDNLISILDKIRQESPKENKRYHDVSTAESINNARARSLIHLFLKVKFGLIEFIERENYITDDPEDGGIDGYFIDAQNKKLFFIQSKFRTSEKNFENKEITLQEILSMDVEEISKGETISKKGNKYNSKILKLIKDIQDIPDKPNYEYKVILLANIKESLQDKIEKIIIGFHPEIYDFEKCYNELVFPLISGTFYNVSELKITINVDSNSAGHRIDHYVKTNLYECNVNALFVPTIEIAKIVSKYKNSILLYNPRSYLDLASGTINSEIASSITDIITNEFALFNNGITMLSNVTNYSDKVGRKNKAEVMVTNPQIINGGQTAFTLSKIYEDCLKNNTSLNVFDDKEVLLKIITFDSNNTNNHDGSKLKLIEDISKATNQQSPINESDRRANDKVQLELQRSIFEEFGLYYERKRGEFLDGINQKYINKSDILNRELFLRVCLAAQDNPSESVSGQSKLFEKKKFDSILSDISNYKKYVFAYKAFQKLDSFKSGNYGNALIYGKYAVTSIVAGIFKNDFIISEYESLIDKYLELILNKWSFFESYVRNQIHNKQYFNEIYDKETGNKIIEAKWAIYYRGSNLNADLFLFFNIKEPIITNN